MCVPAILTRCAQDNAKGLISHIISDNMGFVLGLAFIMILISGVQYMYSGVSPEVQKGAKTRIIGIIMGIVFLYLAQAIIKTVSDLPGLSLPAATIN